MKSNYKRLLELMNWMAGSPKPVETANIAGKRK